MTAAWTHHKSQCPAELSGVTGSSACSPGHLPTSNHHGCCSSLSGDRDGQPFSLFTEAAAYPALQRGRTSGMLTFISIFLFNGEARGSSIRAFVCFWLEHGSVKMRYTFMICFVNESDFDHTLFLDRNGVVRPCRKDESAGSKFQLPETAWMFH